MRTKHRARRVARQLERRGLSAIALQGNMSQGQRDRALQGFRKGRYRILVATDIAARGIDIAGISLVVNADIPNTPEAYTHRIGRTGRSGAPGRALTLVTPADAKGLRAIEKHVGQPIPYVDLATGETVRSNERARGQRSRPRPQPEKTQRRTRSRRSGSPKPAARPAQPPTKKPRNESSFGAGVFA